ncbi:hypothetical protein Hanom_Chr10g00916251 [Helianthus anomalus]
MSLANFRTKFPFKLGMMWYLGKIHSHLDLTPYCFRIAYQISGRNFFQVRDDVTTRDFKVLFSTKHWFHNPIFDYHLLWDVS